MTVLSKRQRIRDPIHNLITFDTDTDGNETLWALVQSQPVQRLRYIRQLGFTDYVFPGATHSRFSHVIGAMHMARRMLPCASGASREQKLAVKSAALLHDVGHGPFSHVFEEIMEELRESGQIIGQSIDFESHERLTIKIIRETEIADILKANALLEPTIELIEQDRGSTELKCIISSQLDCDRLDFLSRDAYFTGARFAQLDLDWLFDSMRIESRPILGDDNKTPEFTIVVDKKGIVALSQYVSTYLNMYSQVYFHKTTRALQHMMTDALKLAFRCHSEKLPRENPIVRFFLHEPNNLNLYAQLTDFHLLSLLFFISEQPSFGDASVIAARYFQRKLYKYFQPITPFHEEDHDRLAAWFGQLKEQGIQYQTDVPPQKIFKQYEITDDEFLHNILVDLGDKVKSFGSIQPEQRTAPPKRHRFYFTQEDDRNEARDIWMNSR